MKLTQIIEEEYKEISGRKKNIIKKIYSKALKNLLEYYEQVNLLHLLADSFPDEQFQCGLKSLFQKNPWTREEITEFSYALTSFQEKKYFQLSGVFLTEMVNVHYEKTKTKKTYIIPTIHLDKKLSHLGKELRGAHLHIEGSAGEECGQNMHKGLLVISGDCENYLGHEMWNGAIKVCGNCKDNCGTSMNNGNIEIFGNAKDRVGKYARGGSIIIHGNCGDNAGTEMENMHIHIKQNCGKNAGSYLKSGSIEINGDALENAGYRMRGGEIIILGSAKKDVGDYAIGGTIFVYGNIEKVGHLFGGEVYWKGNKVEKES